MHAECYMLFDISNTTALTMNNERSKLLTYLFVFYFSTTMNTNFVSLLYVYGLISICSFPMCYDAVN